MDKIGKYNLVREIGRGATATVYLGNDPFTQREVAIKVAFPDILKNQERGKLYTHLFLNEASMGSNLSGTVNSSSVPPGTYSITI